MKNINFSRPVTGEDVDIDSYNDKFRKADDLLNSGIKDKEEFGKLLHDKTLFCYFNFIHNGERLKLFPHQDLVLQDTHKRIYSRWANQTGKSFVLDVKCAINLLIDHGKSFTEGIISKSLPMSSFQMRRIKTILNSMKTISWREVSTNSDSLSVISVDKKDEHGNVKYSNMLVCAPCTEGALGYDFDDLNLDEFEYWKDIDLNYFYNQIAEPRTYFTNGDIWIFTNPNGNDNYGAELETLIMPDGTKKFHTYVFDYLSVPGHTQKDLEERKIGKTRQQIESTLLAIRSISDKNYFTQEEIERSYDKDLTELKMIGKQPFFFLDVGSTHDQCVLVGGFLDYDPILKDVNDSPIIHLFIPIIKIYPVGYPISRVVGSFDEKQDSDGWQYEKSVKDYLQEWSKNGIIPVFGCDVTGNSGIVPLFNTVGINPIDVVFSGPSKSGYYTRYKYFMEKGLVHRIRNKEWEYQAGHLEARKSARGYLMIHHESEDDLDDTQDATAGLIYLANPCDYIEPHFDVI